MRLRRVHGFHLIAVIHYYTSIANRENLIQPTTTPTPIPFFVPRFWLLVIQTIIMKLGHRLRRDASYTDHLLQFYTRSRTPNVEAYGDAFAEVRKELVDAAGLQAGEQVLDVATGAGHQAAAFSRAGFHTIGLDYVPDRLRLACENHGAQKLRWSVGDASRLPFSDNSFDVVSISLALHDMPEDVQIRALGEFRRVARRRLLILEPRAPEGNRIYRWFYILVGNLVDESLHFGEYVKRDFEAHLAQAGIRLREMKWTYHGLLAIYICDLPDSHDN